MSRSVAKIELSQEQYAAVLAALIADNDQCVRYRDSEAANPGGGEGIYWQDQIRKIREAIAALNVATWSRVRD